MALTDNILLCLEFNEATSGTTPTTAADATGNGNSATLQASTSWGVGKVGAGCLVFNGSTNYATLPAALFSGRSTGSISWWAKPSRAHNSGVGERQWGQAQSLGNTPEFAFLHFSNNNIYAGWNTPGGGDDRVTLAASGTNYTQSTWLHYVLTWASGGDSILYCNGASIGTKASTDVGSMALDFRIGHSGLDVGSFFQGSIDQFAAWSRAITADEVSQLYNGGAGLAYSSFNPPSGTIPPAAPAGLSLSLSI